MKAMRITFLIIVAVLSLASAPFFGSADIALHELFEDSISAKIFWEIRLPRVALGALVGAGLSLCGLVYQSLFQNPLASPYTLGVSSAAAFGVTLFLALQLGVEIVPGGAVFSGILGACLCVVLLLSIARRGIAGSATLLLSGVVLSFFFSSLVLFLQYLGDFSRVFQITRWLMGGLEGASSWQLCMLGVLTALAASLVWFKREELDLLACGETIAISKGVDPEKAARLFVIVTSLLVGAIVSVAGPIGFVGIIVPHLTRLVAGPLHKSLIPATLFVGAVFLVDCDTVARTLVSPFEIPVGVVTALLGGPFFLYYLLSKRTY